MMKKTHNRVTVFLTVILLTFFFVSGNTFAQSSIFTSQVPTLSSDDNDYELGVKFVSSVEANITAIRFYKTAGETGVHFGKIWSESGTLLVDVEFTDETPTGWQTAVLSTPFVISANTVYVVSVNANTEYAYAQNELEFSVSNDFLSTVEDGNNGVFNDNPGLFPTMSYLHTNYFRDIVAEVSMPDAPVIVFPFNSAEHVSIETELEWLSVSNAESYTLQVSDDSDFNNLLFNESSLTSTTFFISGLENNTQYFWRVRAENFAGNSPYSQAAFTTIQASIPILSWPINGATVYVMPPILTWYLNTPSFGLKYDLLYSTDPGMLSPTIVYDLTSTSYSLNVLLPGTEYFWQVRSKTASGEIISYSVIENFTTFGVALKPVASWPSGNATVYTYSPSLYWYLNDASFGLTYEVELREGGAGMLTGVPTATDITTYYYETFGLIGGQEYTWRVRSKSGSNYSAWSDPVSFNTIGGLNEPIIPIPSWPVNNADIYISSPSLNWYLGADGTGLTYEVEFVQGNAGDLTGIATHTNITSFTLPLTGLVGGNTYTWSVRSKLGLVYSAWSDPESFSVVSYVNNPVVPTLTWPIGGADVYAASTYLNWYLGSHTGNLTFEIEYGTGVLTGTPTVTDILLTNYELTGLTHGETYNWRVRSTDGFTYSPWSTTETFSVVSTSGVAVVPVPSWPIGGATVYSVDQILYWFLNSNSNGLTYDLKYSVNSDMSDPVIINNISILNYELTGLDYGVEYFWQVRSFDGNVYSAYSDVESFVVYAGSSSAIPRIGSPSGNITVNTFSPNLSWYLPTNSSVLVYEVEYSTNPNMTNSVTHNVTNSSKTIEGLFPDVTYYWRVRSVSTSGLISNYSTIGKFKTNSTTTVDDNTEIPNKFELSQNYPNPFNPSTEIRFQITEGRMVSLIVYDVLGNEVTTLVNEYKTAGSYNINFSAGSLGNASNLSSGVYYYKLTAGDFVSVKKMMLLK